MLSSTLQPNASSSTPARTAQTPEANAAHDADGLPLPRRLAAVAAILGAGVLVVLDGAIANIALPSIAQQLQSTPADAVWIVTAYQLAVVMFLLPASAIGERFGYRRVFAGGVALFTAASVLCALAPSLPWLVAARCLQGLGSAAVMPLGLALLRFTYPRRLLARSIAWNALAVAAASAAGPTLGALLLSVAGWPWLFAVNLPIGLAVLVACAALPSPPRSARQIDVWSIALNAALFAAFVMGCDRLVAHPLQGGAMLALSAICMVLLVRREMPKAAPLIPLDLLRVHSFRVSVIASVCCFTGQMAALVALPFYIQHELGQSAVTAGLLMTPWPLAVMLAAPLSARLAQRIPTAWLCAAGSACFALGLALCALWPLHGNPALPIAVFTSLAGLGFGFFQTPNNQNMLLSAPKERSGAAGGAQGTARLTGLTLGSLGMSLAFALMSPQNAVHWGLGMASLAALTGSVVSLLRSSARTVVAA
ncbi:DHA2 family multidrug resistance protein-like MFS transporter [Variovorax boronicumulans]|uniref:MFS transporter n=1 Tax=Variovorax boronicumulans TaxID=436515 RepID=UPI00277ECFB6|nr:MFS transporter [Variovorax boronicumulans]MDQ0070530.1 DHA2 family multidrug resistance protein-like MFS transporter [Variovorax boronicumulans]